MSVSPISPISPEPSWQPPRKQVTFNNEIEYYGGPGSTPFFVPKKKVDYDEGVELGRLPAEQTPEAQTTHEATNGWLQEQKERKRMVCCLSRKTFIILVVVAVFLLGALLGGVAATLISKKKVEDKKRWANHLYTTSRVPADLAVLRRRRRRGTRQLFRPFRMFLSRNRRHGKLGMKLRSEVVAGPRWTPQVSTSPNIKANPFQKDGQNQLADKNT